MTRVVSVSVVVPAFNCERYLEQAVRSVQAQTISDFELIIVDDGSTDGTLALARRLQAEDARIHVFTQPNSGGPAAPRNRAIEASVAPVIAFLDPDDYWYPHKLARQLEVLSHRADVDLVFDEADLVDADGNPLGRYLGRAGYFERARRHFDEYADRVFVAKGSFFGFASSGGAGPLTSGVMLRRRALDRQASWFPTDLRVGEDIDLWFRIIQSGQAVYIDEPLHAYRQHPASLMQDTRARVTGAITAHSRNFQRAASAFSRQERRAYRARISALYADLGYLEWRQHNLSACRGAYLAAWKWRPGLNVVRGYVQTWLPARLMAELKGLHLLW